MPGYAAALMLLLVVQAGVLAGLGFSPFYAASICLLANTAPVAYGALGTPIIALQAVTDLDLRDLSDPKIVGIVSASSRRWQAGATCSPAPRR